MQSFNQDISQKKASKNFIDWENKIPDPRLDSFLKTGFMLIDDCFEPAFFLTLQQESHLIDYQAAKLTQGERAPHIRGDSTRWIDGETDNHCVAGGQYLQAIERLGQFFNRTLFAGIHRCEAHYAHYPVGFGYDWHKDNPAGRDERVISAVFYLNDNWQITDGGAIALVDKQGITQTLLPQANRLVVFDSNLLHRVETAYRERFSIATWLRKDE